MSRLDPAVLAHLEWLGFVQPTGLVVSASALVRAGALLDRRDIEGQRLLKACVQERVFAPEKTPAPWLPDFEAFARTVLGWSFSTTGYAGTSVSPLPSELEVTLPEWGETLRPELAVREPDPEKGRAAWQLLVRVLEPGEPFEHPVRGPGGLEASAHGRLERLLRQTGVSAGLLSNGRVLRLLSAPRGESSGWLDFAVADMLPTAGRPISTALRLLLSEPRLLALPRSQRLAALLEDSRKYQNEVSERLAEQVLHALYELVRGFQAANDAGASKGALLRQVLAEQPDEVYRGLLTVLLRLVFLLYAEERDMLPEDETFLGHYSLGGLYERLRADAALYPDTMEGRYGAWAQLLVLFRMIHDGAEAGAMRLPRRHGVLFDPDRFPFLEGRERAGVRQIHERIDPPLVPDGTIYRALEKLLVLDGERISYRALDVEQIGSVYETMMGFRLETATGRSVAIKAQKKQGAPTAVDLEALLGEPAPKREKWLQDRADRKLTDTVKRTTAGAATLEDLHAALLPLIDTAATPDLVPKGAMVLQPSEERRRSGSHYTPRALTEPIVRTTLEPILARLRGADARPPTPAQILDLKVCDPAMGSGAFLVEVCRQLGDALVEAWHAHGVIPVIPPDEREEIFAMRLVAQRCLYGVDRNPVAVDLAKVSLWLVTLAKEHALTFVDHALRHGDSLVGLSRKQIEAFHWEGNAPAFQAGFESMRVSEHVAKVSELRSCIRGGSESVSDWVQRDLWDAAQLELSKVRLFGDLVLAAYFEVDKPKERDAKRSEYGGAVVSGEAERYRGWLEEWRQAEQPLAPFHWEIEFPEVFDRDNAGFDAMTGNPPFMSSRNIWSTLGASGRDYLKHTHEGTGGKAVDLVAHFFRQGFLLIRSHGTLGLLATNTVAQGDTRIAGLRWICRNGGSVYCASKRMRWPGIAAVVVSVVHLLKGKLNGSAVLDGRRVKGISSFLVPAVEEVEPEALSSNVGRSYLGHMIHGIGFTFSDRDASGAVTSLKLMREVIMRDARNAERIFPYIGGEEVNSDPLQRSHRYVINFATMTLNEAEAWPDLLTILREKVLPGRESIGGYSVADRRRECWWQFGTYASSLQDSLARLDKCLVRSRVSTWHAIAFQPVSRIFAETLVVFPIATYSAFCAIQANPHEIWARFFGSSMKDDLRYTPSDCFETFPFPENWETHPDLEAAGKAYHDFRAALMVRNDQGLTKTYNRFHDPEERDPEIHELRELHAAIDRAVLEAYGWSHIPTACDFFLDYEIDEEEWGSKKKPWRYRWPDDVRDEVLARLLELNAERAKEEARTGAAADKSKKGRKPAPKAQQTEDLFEGGG